MHLHEFINITYNFERLWNFLCDKKVVRNEVLCPRCANAITLISTRENHIFHCTKHYYKVIRNRKRQKVTCNFKISAFHGTWFEQARIDLPTICRFIGYFLMVQPPRTRFVIDELQLDSHTVVDWTNFCRELLQQWVEKGQNQIGGQGIIVEIDEAKIGKRKYNSGRIVRGQWVFGGIERNTKKTFILPVPNRSTETLLPIIRKYIASGSIVHSDKWRAYNVLENENFTHFTVNHSTNFVNPENGVHTQNVERLWRDMRAGIPRYGIRDYHYLHYIAEFLFKRAHNYSDRIHAFFDIMSAMYPLH